jgi:hypothetical protein
MSSRRGLLIFSAGKNGEKERMDYVIKEKLYFSFLGAFHMIVQIVSEQFHTLYAFLFSKKVENV